MKVVVQKILLKLAQSDIGKNDCRVFMALFANLEFENFILLNQSEIAREIGIKRQAVQKSIKRLLEIGVICQGPSLGNNRSYRLNADFSFCQP